VGKSGAGKSTLVNVVMGIDRSASGEIVIGGAPVHSLKEDRLARWCGNNLGVVFQFIPAFTQLDEQDKRKYTLDKYRPVGMFL
jgi:putative ABC transport system ATP-binding protein